MSPGSLLKRAAVLCVSALVPLAALPAQASATEAPLPEGGISEALHNYVASPDAVAGANDWDCKPTAARPNPVVLLPGTGANVGANFVKLSPALKNAGFCVFAMNYGFTDVSLDRVSGLDHMEDSAAQLDAFVERILQATGASKVDVVGHSQGGSVPIYWMKRLGGAKSVAHYVGWAPSTYGTTLTGLATLGTTLGLLGFATGVSDLLQFPGVLQQTTYSDYTKALHADGKALPAGPEYLVITTKTDTVVTPYATQKPVGENTQWIVLQDKCPFDATGHVTLFLDDPTKQMTLNFLKDGPADFQPRCSGYGIPFW